jgi:phosphoglycerate dehydrogenase-like enzyme
MSDPRSGPWRPRRILLAADHVAGLRDYLASQRADLELRVVPQANIAPSDVAWAEVYIGFRPPPGAGWGAIRWVHSIGAGVDGFLFRKTLPEEIRLTRSAEDFGPAIAEWCLARALAANQLLLSLAESQRRHRWGLEDGVPDPILLRGQQVVTLGTGQVGAGIARGFRAVGCSVRGLSRTGRAAPDFDAVAPTDRFAETVRGAEWLVLAAPLTEATFHFLDRDRLARCGGLYLMNVGRGALIDEAALPEALERGWIRGAALDVFETEPLPAGSPLWDLPGVVISPHNSGPSTVPATGAGFLECLAAFERGEPPRWLVAREREY